MNAKNEIIDQLDKLMARRDAEFRDIIKQILVGYNDNTVAETVPYRRMKRYPDSIFIAVLTTFLQSADELHKRLKRHGVSKATVYARYRELSANPALNIERHGNFYRFKTTVVADGQDHPKRKVAALAGKRPAKVRPIARMPRAAKDNSVKLVNGCGLELMRGMADESADMVLADLPYGFTRTAFDPQINVDEWMAEMLRVVTPNGVVAAFCSQRFTFELMRAGLDQMKDRLIWQKGHTTGQQLLGRHLQEHEDIVIFSHGGLTTRAKSPMVFNPQNVVPITVKVPSTGLARPFSKQRTNHSGERISMTNYPRTILHYPKNKGADAFHSFAKPVPLLEYLIRTYSNDNALVLDPTMGSGSSGVAAKNVGRRFIGAENGFNEAGQSIFEIASKRIGEVGP